jgi:hypothetical protein
MNEVNNAHFRTLHVLAVNCADAVSIPFVEMARAMPVRSARPAGLDLTLIDLGEDMFHNVARFLAPKDLLACSATSRHFRCACLNVSALARSGNTGDADHARG